MLDLLPPDYGYKVVTFEINDNRCDNNSKLKLSLSSFCLLSTKDFAAHSRKRMAAKSGDRRMVVITCHSCVGTENVA